MNLVWAFFLACFPVNVTHTEWRESPPPAEADVRAFEKEMEERPREAFLIARRHADALKGQEAVIRRLFLKAARLQEDRLARLGEAQVVELADVYVKTLSDQTGARRVLQAWLKSRIEGLPEGDAEERLRLARLCWLWLKDRGWAAQLCQQALQTAPDFNPAAQMLVQDLRYRKAEVGWVPAELPGENSIANRVRPGMSADEVRRFLGPPKRTARQLVFRRHLEQWTYDDPFFLIVEFACPSGQEPHVQTVHEANPPKK
jgi:hypothetical protein